MRRIVVRGLNATVAIADARNAADDAEDAAATAQTFATSAASALASTAANVTAAAAARTGAEAARDAAEAIIVTDLGTTDGQTRALIEASTSQTAQALATTTVDRQQATAGTALRLFRATPTDAAMPFEIHYNSYPNVDGTKNHATFLGYNPGNHSNHPDFDPSKPSAQIGLEQDYVDGFGSGRRGPEFYFEVRDPTDNWDLFRTIYTRPEYDANPAIIHGIIHMDIGNGTDGHFTVLSDLMHQDAQAAKLLEVTKQSVQAFKQLNLLDNLVMSKPANAQAVFASTTGQTTVTLDSPSPAVLVFKTSGATGYQLAGLDTNTFQIIDKTATARMTFATGLTTLAGNVSVGSLLQVGTFGPKLSNRRISDDASSAVMDFGAANWPTANPSTGATGIGFASGGGVKISTATIYTGAGAPSHTPNANGDIYLRTDGGAGTTMYQRRAGAWVATAA